VNVHPLRSIVIAFLITYWLVPTSMSAVSLIVSPSTELLNAVSNLAFVSTSYTVPVDSSAKIESDITSVNATNARRMPRIFFAFFILLFLLFKFFIFVILAAIGIVLLRTLTTRAQ